MTPEQWQRLRPILESALELDSADRPAFLDEACAEPSLRQEIESLIAAHEQAGTNALAPSAVASFIAEEELRFRLPPGKHVGPYEILEEIAQGGMGAVYRAIRADGQYKQQVALKIVRADLGTELAAARFRNERQVLASLDHPNIAKILDGGTTADGLPYFVMELIDGLPVTEYCDRHTLSIEARLKIFRTVCSAVHYAHQHLVIHRDIKPTNILVASDGVPKLLDFGIAKILDPNLLPENATMTAAGLWMMTPEYASPEQLRGEAITTATDVYSLGLVLYELLTGHRAYRFASRMPHEVARAVLETEPEKPSAAIRREEAAGDEQPGTAPLTPEVVANLRGDSAPRLQRRLAGDLDNIVLKAIRKEPRERYSSADQLSDDIRRHLEGLPVLARKSTLAYRARKYVLRHKVGVTAAALIFLSLLTGIVLTLREARIARANQLRAERRFNDVRKLANSLMFEIHDSIRQLPGATAPRKLVIQRAQEYLDSLAQESGSDPALLRELSSAYVRLASVQGNPQDANVGDTVKALQNNHKAVALLEEAVAIDPANRDTRRELAQCNIGLATIEASAGDQGGRKKALDDAVHGLEALAAVNPEDLKAQAALAEAYANMGFYFNDKADLSQGLIYQQKALSIFQQLASADPQDPQYQIGLSFSHKRVASILMVQNQLPQALEHERAALAIDEAQLALHPDNARARFNITYTYSDTGFILGTQGDFDGAITYYNKALAIRAALAAADPQDTRARQGLANTYLNVAIYIREKGDFAAALKSFEKALAIRETLARRDPTNEPLRFSVAVAQSDIGDLYALMAFKAGTPQSQKLRYCRNSLAWNRKAFPAWAERKAQGKLIGGEVRNYEILSEKLEKCDRTVARLEHMAESSPR